MSHNLGCSRNWSTQKHFPLSSPASRKPIWCSEQSSWVRRSRNTSSYSHPMLRIVVSFRVMPNSSFFKHYTTTTKKLFFARWSRRPHRWQNPIFLDNSACAWELQHRGRVWKCWNWNSWTLASIQICQLRCTLTTARPSPRWWQGWSRVSQPTMVVSIYMVVSLIPLNGVGRVVVKNLYRCQLTGRLSVRIKVTANSTSVVTQSPCHAEHQTASERWTILSKSFPLSTLYLPSYPCLIYKINNHQESEFY